MKEGKSQGEHIYSFFYTIFKRKRLIFAVGFATFAGVLFGTFLVTPLWQATAKIRVQYSPRQQLSMAEGLTTPAPAVSGVNPANDLIQLLNSRDLAEKIALEFGRDKIWYHRISAPDNLRDRVLYKLGQYLNPVIVLERLHVIKGGPENYLADAVDELQNSLEQIELESDTTIVDVSIWGESPETATAMTNRLVQLALDRNASFSREPVTVAIESTRRQLAEADGNLRQAQDRLKKFKEETGFVLYSEEARILLQRRDQSVSQLKDMESKLLSMKLEKRADHPDIKSLEVQIKEAKEETIPGLDAQLKTLSQREIVYENLQKDLSIREGLYTTLQQKLLELEILHGSAIGDLEVKIVDPAKVYSDVKPDWPKKAINAILGLIAGISSGLLCAFFVEYFDSSYRSVKTLEEGFDQPVLGAIPKLGFVERRRAFASDERRGMFASNAGVRLSRLLPGRGGRFLVQYGPIADHLLLNGKTPARSLLVTSPGEAEGKSWVAALLSTTLARRGKRVLLVECNLRAPALARILRVGRGGLLPWRAASAPAGLLEYCEGRIELKDAVRHVNGVDVLFAGHATTATADSIEVLAALKESAELNALRSAYDFVVLDSPSMKGHNDPLVLAGMADGVVVVVEANKTPRRTVMMSLQRLKDAGAGIAGLILNKRVNYIPNAIQNLIDSV
jgi:tyrosine-protein kinase Etk/Wzc